jgi:hypothetical protein
MVIEIISRFLKQRPKDQLPTVPPKRRELVVRRAQRDERERKRRISRD